MERPQRRLRRGRAAFGTADSGKGRGIPPAMAPTGGGRRITGRSRAVPVGEEAVEAGEGEGKWGGGHGTAAGVISSADKSARTAVEDVIADEAAGGSSSGRGDRRRGRGQGTAAGYVVSWSRPGPQKGEGPGPAASNRRDGCGECRCGRGRGGGAEPGPPPWTTPQDGRGGRRFRGRGCTGRPRGDVAADVAAPDGFRGYLLRTRLLMREGERWPLQTTLRDVLCGRGC